MKLRLAVLLIATGLAACELFPSRDAATPGMAEVVVYRPGRLIAFTRNYPLELDGAGVAELANGSFVRLYLPPGAHSFGIGGKPGIVWSETLSTDRRYYLQLEVGGAPPEFEVELRPVAAEVAEGELKDLRELPPPGEES